MADGKYQCKSPKANAPIVMQCNKSVRLSKAMKFSEVAKNTRRNAGFGCLTDILTVSNWL
ncbi:MAG: hypothetical protein CM15mP84_02800 [Cellvibrionales bacterium]|nr:MAG: hypothetical protein CM15mP84_02800 [Cellvibrionales bacterium]